MQTKLPFGELQLAETIRTNQRVPKGSGLADLEAEVRRQLMSYLEPEFVCSEEISLRCETGGYRVRADVVAIPRSEEFQGITLAFEVKFPKANWELKNWISALKQASDYVGATVVPNCCRLFQDRKIDAAFVYPFPSLVPSNIIGNDAKCPLRPYDFEPLRGALDLGALFRVGAARIVLKPKSTIELRFGPNRIWSGIGGYSQHAWNTLLGKRHIGAQMK